MSPRTSSLSPRRAVAAPPIVTKAPILVAVQDRQVRAVLKKTLGACGEVQIMELGSTSPWGGTPRLIVGDETGLPPWRRQQLQQQHPTATVVLLGSTDLLQRHHASELSVHRLVPLPLVPEHLDELRTLTDAVLTGRSAPASASGAPAAPDAQTTPRDEPATRPTPTAARRPATSPATGSAQSTEGRSRAGAGGREQLGDMIGASPSLKEVFALVRQVGPSTASVLILGESGTGKELVAKALHELSVRRHGPFVAINCGALPREILENELFGHEKGAYTGSGEAAAGVVEQANGGTLFLDEIGEMSPDLQVKLLRMLESRTIRRLGGRKDLPIDLRIVAATNRDPHEAMAHKLLRQDLYYRLAVIEVQLPPLRSRPEDLDVLIEAFCEQFARANRTAVPVVSEATRQILHHHGWPGNVRELRNVMERAVLLGGAGPIEPRHLPPEFQPLLTGPKRRASDPAPGARRSTDRVSVERRLERGTDAPGTPGGGPPRALDARPPAPQADGAMHEITGGGAPTTPVSLDSLWAAWLRYVRSDEGRRQLLAIGLHLDGGPDRPSGR